MGEKNYILWNNKWLWTLIFMGMYFFLSMIKMVSLPKGGAITYFSFLMVWLAVYFFGVKRGFLCVLLLSVVRFAAVYITGEYINYEIGALILEYPLAHMAFLLGGFIKEPNLSKKFNDVYYEESFKLKMGYVIGMVGVLLLYVIAAMCFYPEERPGFAANLLYSIGYDASYLAIEGVMTFVALCIPSFADAIYYLKYVATNKHKDDTMESF